MTVSVTRNCSSRAALECPAIIDRCSATVCRRLFRQFDIADTALRYQTDILLLQLRHSPEAHSKTGVLRTGSRNKNSFELSPSFSSHIGDNERLFAHQWRTEEGGLEFQTPPPPEIPKISVESSIA